MGWGMGGLVYEAQKEPGVRGDMNQFTGLNGSEKERAMPVHAASIWKSVRYRVSGSHLDSHPGLPLNDAQGLITMNRTETGTFYK